ncbi:hypothetical protein [uncultured Chitinophaga sp.]|jgi:hypothetical protein|uniref:hypothetical protein n=1 Tax=uncultured Chitinophaga sp. TaxID=339340 RepID=UPI00262568F5|nr:hypothetical protein [uncultured Chitinophaga sp.]
MKQKYYVNDNPQFNGDHEVHAATCEYLPVIYKCTYLGEFENCQEAINEAKKRYRKANGCFDCSRPCHTT